MICDECKSEAIGSYTWGFYEYMRVRSTPDDKQEYDKRTTPMHQSNLCKIHLDELWKIIHGPVNTGRMHFTAQRL